MVLLEQQANVFKNYAFFETERTLVPGNAGSRNIIDSAKWSAWCATKQIARLRAAAGVTSYMNDFTVRFMDSSCFRIKRPYRRVNNMHWQVRTNFQRDNNCIRAVWVSWYNAYLASNPPAANPGNVNVSHVYDNFVRSDVPVHDTTMPKNVDACGLGS